MRALRRPGPTPALRYRVHVRALFDTLRAAFAQRWTSLAGVGALCAFAPALQLSDSSVRYVQIAMIVIFVILSLSLHEAAHAWTAWKLGDSTAKDLGRVTLNPLPSIDPIMTVIVPLVLAASGLPAFGGARPVPVSYHRLRNPLRDMMLVALAGPATNFLLAGVFMVGWKLAVFEGGYRQDDLLVQVLSWSMYANLILAAFNMLPVPPLDGSRVMAWLLPSGIRESYVNLERFGLFLVLGVWYFIPGVKSVVTTGMLQMRDLLNWLSGGSW